MLWRGQSQRGVTYVLTSYTIYYASTEQTLCTACTVVYCGTCSALCVRVHFLIFWPVNIYEMIPTLSGATLRGREEALKQENGKSIWSETPKSCIWIGGDWAPKASREWKFLVIISFCWTFSNLCWLIDKDVIYSWSWHQFSSDGVRASQPSEGNIYNLQSDGRSSSRTARKIKR